MTRRRIVGLIVLPLALGACSSRSAAASPPATASPTPTTAAVLGVPFRVSMPDGSAADVTLDAVHYSPVPSGDPTSEFAVLDVVIVGRSAGTFHYDEGAFAFQYAGDADPYRPDDSGIWNADPTDLAAFPPTLGSGTLKSGQQAHGMVPLRVQPGSQLLIEMRGGHAAVLAEWLATSGATG